MAEASQLSQMVMDELSVAASRIRAAACALRLWDRYFTPKDRKRLSGNVDSA